MNDLAKLQQLITLIEELETPVLQDEKHLLCAKICSDFFKAKEKLITIFEQFVKDTNNHPEKLVREALNLYTFQLMFLGQDDIVFNRDLSGDLSARTKIEKITQTLIDQGKIYKESQ